MGSLFGKQKIPEAKPSTPIPTEDDEAIRAAKLRSAASQKKRGGRSSTFLTGGLGGGDNDLG